MEVDRFSFPSRLPDILSALATAHFVAFDLELSGIQSRGLQSRRPTQSAHRGKHTLQERYEEMKEAAERYQILQVGLTCVEEDTTRGLYTLRPYNFFLSPVVEEKLDVERIFSYQSGAVQFLLGHQFKMEAPFLQGVPYLSREEEASARRMSQSRLSGNAFEDIQLKADDLNSINFVRRVRQEIEVWRNRDEEEPNFLNIAAIGGETMNPTTRGLNNYQKRLVHQLVRAEYPKLVSVGRPTFIQISAKDTEREDIIQRNRAKWFEEQLSRQIGLRWLVEAMVGGDLSGIDARTFARTSTGEPMFVDHEAIREHLAAVKDQLKGHPTVLVGHNLFADLLYFYQCFLGQLPDKVEDFQSIIHTIFPMVIDTKYLATHNCGPITLKSSLAEIAEDLRHLRVPLIETHVEHPKYSTQVAPHEAGFDSFLTAKVLIRLSAQLAAAGTYGTKQAPPMSSDDEDYETAPEEPSESLDSASNKGKSTTGKTSHHAEDRTHSNVDVIPQEVSLDETESKPTQNPKPRAKKSKRKTKKATVRSKFAHSTRFDLLRDLPSDEDVAPTSRSETAQVVTAEPPQPEPESKRDDMMPPFHSDFWKVYGNKLRVFGTVEDICYIDQF